MLQRDDHLALRDIAKSFREACDILVTISKSWKPAAIWGSRKDLLRLFARELKASYYIQIGRLIPEGQAGETTNEVVKLESRFDFISAILKAGNEEEP